MFAYEKNMTWQNNYIIFLFIHSELYMYHNGTLIVSVISRDTSWTKYAVILYAWIFLSIAVVADHLFFFFGLFLSYIRKMLS